MKIKEILISSFLIFTVAVTAFADTQSELDKKAKEKNQIQQNINSQQSKKATT